MFLLFLPWEHDFWSFVIVFGSSTYILGKTLTDFQFSEQQTPIKKAQIQQLGPVRWNVLLQSRRLRSPKQSAGSACTDYSV